MTDKAYIVANEQQEKILLAKLEQQGCSWNDTENTPPTEWHLGRYPYAIFVKYGKKLVWGFNVDVSEVEIVAEDKQDKFKISKEVYDALVDWRDNHELQTTFISGSDLFHFPNKIVGWLKDTNTLFDNRNRLIAIICWLNGEDVFEVEKKNKKWVVRSKGTDEDDNYSYVFINLHNFTFSTYHISNATKFDTKEEAKSWANAHQEVVEVENE